MIEDRKESADATVAYFQQLDSESIAEENALAGDMMTAAAAIDFDAEI